MFEKFEGWSFDSPSASEVHAASWAFWVQRGYQLQPNGPLSFQGRSYQSKIGIYRVVDVSVVPTTQGAHVQLRYRADVRPDFLAGGAIVAVLLLPVAVVGAAISWAEYESDWSEERWAFWSALVSGGKARPSPGAPPPPPPPVQSTTSPLPPAPPTSGAPPAPPAPPTSPGGSPAAHGCPSCHAPVTGAGRFCASCGAAIPLP